VELSLSISTLQPTHPMPPSSGHKRVFGDLAVAVAKDSNLVKLLEQSFIPEERTRLTNALLGLLPGGCSAEVKDIFSAFSTYCRSVILDLCYAFHC